MHLLQRLGSVRRIAGVAIVALLLGPFVVLAHSVAHAHVDEPAAQRADAAHGWGHDAGSAVCQLVDQLLSGQAPGTDRASADPAPPAALRVAAPPSSSLPRPVGRPYDPRGPPRDRVLLQA